MDDHQDDAYEARHTDLEAQFHALPPVGSDNYWRRIEEPAAGQRLPLEVLARCYRERNAAGAVEDADRIMNIIVKQVQPAVRPWARHIAKQAPSGTTSELQQDLEQECLVKLWAELASDDPTYLLINFTMAFLRLRQHVAHSVMEKAGEWQRQDVKNPTRIPRGTMDSLQAQTSSESEFSLDDQLEDEQAQSAFKQVDLSYILDVVRSLPENQRTVILDRFWEGLTQEETAAKLGISTRMVRYLLKKALRELGVRFGDGEEGNGV